MPRLRNAEDQVIDVDDADVGYYSARGWTPETIETQISGLEREAAGPGDSGIIGTLDAAASGLISGATLGLSDVVASSLSTTNTRELIEQNRKDNAVVSGVANFAGSLAPAIVNPASLLARTPAGLLANASTKLYTAGRELGGVRGAIAAVGAGAAEGAVSNAGSYLAEVALADKDVTAEGLSGALGSGFAFGGALGGAALGIEKGTIAARKLIARAPEAADEAAAVATAASDWERKSKEMLDAHEQAAEAARRQLDEARVARETAALAKKTAASKVAETKATLSAQMPDEVVGIPSFADLDPGVATPNRIIPYEEIAERGWSQPANRKMSDAEIDFYRKSIENGEIPTVNISIARNDDVIVNGSDAAIMEAARDLKSPIAVRFERAKLNEAPTTYPDGTPAFIKRGSAIDAENAMLDGIKARIVAGEIPGELGPFTPDGLDQAARRTMQRIGGREDELAKIVAEFDAAKAELEAMKARILAKEIEGEIGPFTPAGLERAAQRELSRQTEAAQAAAAAPPTTATGRPERMKARPAPPQSGKSLEQLLQETADKMGEGATFKDLQDLAAAPSRAAELADEINEAAAVMTRYERAAAAISDVAGDAAPATAKDAAKGLRDAEAAAEKRMMGSAAQSLDDAAELGPSPAKLTYRESLARRKAAAAERSDSIRRAQQDVADADVEIARLRIVETEAEQADRLARLALRKTKAEVKATKPDSPVQFDENDFDIPLLSSVPVIGPMLNSFLRHRGARAAAAGGRVAVTPRGKIAAFAIKTRDTIFNAVDKSLGVVQSGAEKAPKYIRPLASAGAVKVLSERSFDDGEPDAPEKATTPQKTAVRMREVAFAATNPQAVAQRVRRELRGVDDPEMVAAAIAHQQSIYTYLNDTAPKRPPENPFARREWEPSMSLSMQWGRRLEVAFNPLAAFEAMEQSCLTPEAAETLRKVYPRMFAEAQQRLVSRAGDIKTPIPYRSLLQNSLLFNVPLHPSVEPENMMILATSHSAPPEAAASLSLTPPPAAPPSPPVPSIAGGVDLTSLYQTGLDRRAMR